MLPTRANTSNSQQDFLQQLISDSSSAFRSHPLFPLLRDLIIADVNFQEKSFPHTLIVNLPSDFNKLLKVGLVLCQRLACMCAYDILENVLCCGCFLWHWIDEHFASSAMVHFNEEHRCRNIQCECYTAIHILFSNVYSC